MRDIDTPEAQPKKASKSWQHHVGVGVKVFLILVGTAILFTALSAPCILLAFRGSHC